MKKNSDYGIAIFLCCVFILCLFVVLKQNAVAASTNGNNALKTINISDVGQQKEIRIDWPDNRGISIQLNQIAHNNYLDLQLSVYDTYEIAFVLPDDSVESIYVNTGIDIVGGQQYQKILHLIPEYISEEGYRKIIIYPINGDGFYSLQHLSLITVSAEPDRQAYPGYQIVDFEIPKFEIEIDQEDYDRLEQKRKAALSLGILLTDPSDMVPAKVRSFGKKYKAEVRLKGDWTDHIQTDKWAMRVKISGGDAVMGMDEFSLQPQETRVGIWEYLIHQMYIEKGGIGLRYDFVDVVVNGVYKGVYALEESFNKLPVEHSLKREAPILKYNEDYLWQRWAFYNSISLMQYWTSIEPFSLKKTFTSPYLYGYAQYGIDLLDRLLNNEIDVSQVMDLDIYAKFAAVLDTFATIHGTFWHNMRLYVNPFTGKLEPITFDNAAFTTQQSSYDYPDYFFQIKTPIIISIINNDQFLDAYFRTLQDISTDLDDFLNRHSKMISQFEYILRRDNNGYRFNADQMLSRNKEIQSLFDDQGLSCYWVHSQDTGYSIVINNNNDAPTVIERIHAAGDPVKTTQEFPLLLDFSFGKSDLSTIDLSVSEVLASDAVVTVDYRLTTSDKIKNTSCAKEQESFSFFVAGHAYGTPDEKDNGIHLPLLNYLDNLANNESIKFGVFTGDFMYTGELEQSYLKFLEQIKPLGKPIFATPGNHDEYHGIGDVHFVKYFGSKYSSYVHNNNLFLFLDPDDQTWSISPDQIDFIKGTLESNPNVSNIFVFSHQLIWWEQDDPRFSLIAPNSTDGKNGIGNFWTEVFPIFEEGHKDVYFIAGDVGAFPTSTAYSYTVVDNYKFISSGMGGGIQDNIIIVNVSSDEVTFDLIALNGDDPQRLGKLEDFPSSEK